MAKNVGVLLSGCGFLDGAEVHESVLTLLALDQKGATAVCCAPDVEQAGVVDHLTKKPSGEKRNVLHEAARIARGDIRDVAAVRASELDALLIPGGFGAASDRVRGGREEQNRQHAGVHARPGPGGGF
jgi:enhancing lycopene biosynthesis protein 2